MFNNYQPTSLPMKIYEHIEDPIIDTTPIEDTRSPEEIIELCVNEVCKQECPMIGFVALTSAMLVEKRPLSSTEARTLAREVITRSGNMCKAGPVNGECQSTKPVPEFVQRILEAIRQEQQDQTPSGEAE
jgi:hypothetical protein